MMKHMILILPLIVLLNINALIYTMNKDNQTINLTQCNNPAKLYTNADVLYNFCKVENLDLLKYALNHGLSPNTALFPLLKTTLSNGAIESAKELIKRGAYVSSSHIRQSISLCDNELFNSIFSACEDFDIEEEKEEYWHTLLHEAAAKGTPEMVEKFIELDFNIEAQDRRNRTPLFVAVKAGNIQKIRVLIAKGANLHAENKSGKTILMLAQKSPIAAKNIKVRMQGLSYLSCGKQLHVEITDYIASFYK